MAFSQNRKKFVCVALAASFIMQANLVCYAASGDASNTALNADTLTVPLTDAEAETAPTAENEIVYNVTEAEAKKDQLDLDTLESISPILDTSSHSDATQSADRESVPENTYGHFTLNGPLGSPEPGSEVDDLPLLAQGPPMVGQPQLIGERMDSPPLTYTLAGGASMSPNEAMSKINLLTRDILLKEIELQKFNLHYTSEVAKQGRWKGLRYAFLQELNAGTGLAGAIISVANRGSYLHRPAGVKPYAQQSANYIPAIGSIVGAAAALMEFGINGYHDVVARRHGFSPAAAMKHVSGIKSDIDSMMAERQALTKVEATSPELAGHVEVDEAEGKVLKDLRDQSIQEFERFHVGARRTIAFPQMQYFFDFSKYTTNAIGYYFAYLSLHRRHRVWNGRAGVLFLVSGQLTMWGPILSRVAAKGVGHITKHRIKSIVADSEGSKIATLEADLAAVNRVRSRAAAPSAVASVDRNTMYALHTEALSKEIASAEKKNASSKLTATQNIVGGLYVGGTKTASGVLFTIPGFNSNYNNSSDRASRVTNDLLFTASLIAIPSGAYSMIDTLRIQVKAEINRHKAKLAGTLPGQIVAARLKQLDEMEAKLRAK